MGDQSGQVRKSTSWGGSPADRVAVALVSAIALGVAGVMLASYYAHPDDLWRDVYHDRNSHLLVGMNFALSIKTADPAGFFSQLLAMRVWGPLHGLVLALVFLVGGVDHRLGIVPSLIGWVATVVFSFLIARRLFSNRLLGLTAGTIAAVWVVASPAFRLLGSDVMLEGLGAGLTALALWSYQAARDGAQSPARWRLLAIVLTALFFHKANYWGLVVLSLAVAAASEGAAWRARAGAFIGARLKARGWTSELIRDPLLIAFLILVMLIACLYWRGPEQTTVFGHAVSLYPPENLVTVAYGLLFVRFWLVWRRHRAAIREALGVPGRSLFYWHAAPVAISFLLPKRLAAFLWFVGPANSHAGERGFDPLGGVQQYWQAFSDGFSVAPWSAALALGLAGVAALRLRQFSAGGRAVFACALISILGVLIHPQHQGRFLASWVFTVWICAGAGAAVILGQAIADRFTLLRAAAASLIVGALALGSIVQRPSPAAYAVAIRATSGPSDAQLVRPALAALAGARVIGVATTFGPSDVFAWVAEEHCGCRLSVERPWIGPTGSRADVRGTMLATLAQSRADRWIVVDAPGSAYRLPSLGFTYDRLAGVVDAMQSQTRYRPILTYAVPAQGAVVTVYGPAR